MCWCVAEPGERDEQGVEVQGEVRGRSAPSEEGGGRKGHADHDTERPADRVAGQSSTAAEHHQGDEGE